MMTNVTTIMLAILLNLLFIDPASAQARLILNGAKINIVGGASLVVNNAAGNAITRYDGHIISEGDNNTIKWIIGSAADSYVIPWGLGSSGYLPLSFTTSSATGSGTFLFSTYQTSWQNSTLMPPGITNVSRNGTDNSAYLLDRFWQIDALGYTIKPTLSNLSFGYLDIEHSQPSNTITESLLAAQRWNDDINIWSDMNATGLDDATNNRVSIASLNASDLYKWWVLVERDFALPLRFLTFVVQNKDNHAKLIWTTSDEVNVKDFTIQRSFNGTDFTSIGDIASTGNITNQYDFTDLANLSGTIYYRLKENDLDGSSEYSKIRTITIHNSQLLQIFPNPVLNGKIMIDVSSVPAGRYTFSLYDPQSKLVFLKSLHFNKNLVEIILDIQTRKGIYMAVITGPNTLFIKRILIEGK
ncbi:MAG: T9SS type A sorting domain-containing protein [Chitinophagaceae bacterium]|nr:T9SS type A sorting domain-containing protein [Chitinophagaceae bacterium]